LFCGDVSCHFADRAFHQDRMSAGLQKLDLVFFIAEILDNYARIPSISEPCLHDFIYKKTRSTCNKNYGCGRGWCENDCGSWCDNDCGSWSWGCDNRGSWGRDGIRDGNSGRYLRVDSSGRWCGVGGGRRWCGDSWCGIGHGGGRCLV